MLLLFCRGAISPPDKKIILTQIRTLKDHNPQEALRLLSTISDTNLIGYKNELLFNIYIDQREYRRADSLLNLGVGANRDTVFMIKLKTSQNPGRYCPTVESEAIQHTLRENWTEALRLFAISDTSDDLIKYYYLKALLGSKDSLKGLKLAETIDSLPRFLLSDYYQMMIELHLWSNPQQALKWVDLLKDKVLKLYYKHQITGKGKYLWQIIRRFPKSWAADYALQAIKPRTKKQYLIYSNALFKQGRYYKALSYLRRIKSDQAQFLIGMCLLRVGEKDRAYGYLKESGIPEAYYEIARSLPDTEAIDYYQAVTLKKPRKSLKRKSMISQALALERTGRIKEAVEVELDFIKEFSGTEAARRLLLRSAINLIRLGNLEMADSLLSLDSLAPFYYWRGKIKTIKGNNPDSQYTILKERFPFSYYSIYRLKSYPKTDTTNLSDWISSLTHHKSGDTSIFVRVKKYYDLGLTNLVDRTIANYRTDDPVLMYRIIIFSRNLGLDWHSINLARRLIRRGIKEGKKTFPLELIKLAYPIHYLPSLLETKGEIPLILALIWQESNFNPGAISPAGARGLLQIMPGTGKLISRDLEEPYDPDSLFKSRISIRYGTYYLNNLQQEFGSWVWALIGYNAGPHRIRYWLRTYPSDDQETFIELIPFRETRNYIKRILMLYEIYRWLFDLSDLS